MLYVLKSLSHAGMTVGHPCNMDYKTNAVKYMKCQNRNGVSWSVWNEILQQCIFFGVLIET